MDNLITPSPLALVYCTHLYTLVVHGTFTEDNSVCVSQCDTNFTSRVKLTKFSTRNIEIFHFFTELYEEEELFVMPSMRQGRWNNPTQNADYFMSTSPGGASCCQEASDFNRWKNSHNNNSSSTSRQSSPMEDITTAIEKLEKKKSLISNFNSTSRYQERSVSSPASSTKPSSSSTYPSQSSSWRLTTCGTSQMSSFNTWQQSTTDSSPRPSSQSFLSSNSSHKNDHLMSMD